MGGRRPDLTGMVRRRNVRRYARAHPHAFPLVATRPPSALWSQPAAPVAALGGDHADRVAKKDSSDEQVLLTYLTFNGFLLGHLLLETSAMTLRDPKPGDGSFAAADTATSEERAGTGRRPRPGSGRAEPGRFAGQPEAVEDADSPLQRLHPADDIDARRFPTVHRLAGGLARDVWEQEFESGLSKMLHCIAAYLAGRKGSSSA